MLIPVLGLLCGSQYFHIAQWVSFLSDKLAAVSLDGSHCTTPALTLPFDSDLHTLSASGLPISFWNEKYANYRTVSAGGCTKVVSSASMRSRSSVISTSITSAEQTFESESTCNEHVSSKRCEISSPSSDKITQSWPMPMKSDISIETGLPLSNVKYVMDGGEKQVNHLNAAVEDGFDAIKRDKQNKSESSCSNSSSCVLPVSLSSLGHQETLKEAGSFKNHSGSMSSSNSAVLHHRVTEPLAASSELDISAQISHKAIISGRARKSMKSPLMINNLNSFHNEKVNAPISSLQNQDNGNISWRDEEDSHDWSSGVGIPRDGVREIEEETDIYKWTTGCTSSNEEKRDVISVGKSLICSGDSNNLNCLSKYEENASSDENDNCVNFVSSKGVMNPEMLGESENVLAIKGKSVEMDSEAIDNSNDFFLQHESSAVLMRKSTKVSEKDQNTFVLGFDLNEDIHTNYLDDHMQSVVEKKSSHNLIHVVAKAGVPRGKPMIPMQFEGGLGWTGSAATSAFHPVAISKSSDKKPYLSNYTPQHAQVFTGIDLNVAATVEDNPEIGSEMEHVQTSPASSSFQNACLEVGLRRAEKLNIDLNCICDGVDESNQSPTESKNLYLKDLDLNVNTSSGYTHGNVDWQGQSNKSSETRASFSVSSREHNVNFSRSSYLTGLSSMRVFNHAHAKSYLMAAPNVLQSIDQMQGVAAPQPKSSYSIHMLPTHNYPSNGPFYVGPTKPLTFGMHYSHKHAIFPQLLSPETVPTSVGIPHLVKVARGQSCGDIMSSRPISMSRRDEAREFMLPAKNSLLDDNGTALHQEAWYTKPMKRKEPEGGWDPYHFGHRQLT